MPAPSHSFMRSAGSAHKSMGLLCPGNHQIPCLARLWLVYASRRREHAHGRHEWPERMGRELRRRAAGTLRRSPQPRAAGNLILSRDLNSDRAHATRPVEGPDGRRSSTNLPNNIYPSSKSTPWSFWFVLIFGALIRFCGLGHKQLWLDELIQAVRSSPSSLMGVLKSVADDRAQAPLDYIIQHYLANLLGQSGARRGGGIYQVSFFCGSILSVYIRTGWIRYRERRPLCQTILQLWRPKDLSSWKSSSACMIFDRVPLPR